MRSYLPAHERVWIYADQSGGPESCWPWTANRTRKGYGQIKVDGVQLRAHRVAYEAAIGSIPEGYDIDHRCHTDDPSCPGGDSCLHRRCINPAHLEVVTKLENFSRGRSPAARAVQTGSCKNGHPFDESNTYRATYRPNARWCRACNRAAAAKSKATRKAAQL